MYNRFSYRYWNGKEMIYQVSILNNVDHIAQCTTFDFDEMTADCILLPERLTTCKTLMQCTGLKDSKGNFIWEGDILIGFREEDCGGCYDLFIGKIEYNNDCALFFIKANVLFSFYENFHFDVVDLSRTKILGNIYEHPHLLIEEPN